MLTIPLDKLAFIVAKAREFDAETAPSDPESGSNPADDGERDVLEDTPDNPAEQELIGAIDQLTEPERVELVALVWLGRGDYEMSEWRDALHAAAEAHNGKEAAYLAGTPLLADYIEEGLSQHGLSLEDYEIGRL